MAVRLRATCSSLSKSISNGAHECHEESAAVLGAL